MCKERKSKGKREKWKSLPREREGAKKLCFPQLQTKIIFIGNVMCEREREIYGREETKFSYSESVKREKAKKREKKWERDCFPKKYLENDL